MDTKKAEKVIIGILVAMVFAILFGLGYLAAKHRYNKPIETKVERDTIVHYDTIPHYYPKPIEVTKTKTEYRWLTRVFAENVGQEKFSVDSAKNSASFPNDSVLVEVPIESRHYHGEEYDAYISGYLTSLDSIFIRQKTEYITERIMQMKPPNRWELDLVGGIDYRFNDKKYTPHVGGELLYKPNRLQVGVQGGIQYDDKVQPFVGGVVKIRIH